VTNDHGAGPGYPERPDGPSDEAVAEFVQAVADALGRRYPEWLFIPRRPGVPPPPGSVHLPLARRRSSAPPGDG
jgi:hypothetical protein